jgi:hypothetical protein
MEDLEIGLPYIVELVRAIAARAKERRILIEWNRKDERVDACS